jgi:type I restriction-modification system DNA methylase subunit
MAQTNANLIWKIAELLRGPYQPNQYGDVILPFTILRRLDCLAVSAGANVKAVQRMLGHAKASMTLDVYADLFDDDLDGVADRLDAAIVSTADALRTVPTR